MNTHTTRKTLTQQILAFLGFLVPSVLAGGLGTLFTIPNVDGWYAEAEKVAWSPPNWLFAPTWSALYFLIALSAWLIWRNTDERLRKARKTALIVYAIQIVLNGLWTPVFFGGYPAFGSLALWIGLVIIVALAVTIVIMIAKYRKISALAAWLMLPYLLWILFATSLNAGVAILNP